MRSAVGAGQDGGGRVASAGDAGAGPLQVGTVTAGTLTLGDLATVDVSQAGRMELGAVLTPASSGQLRIGSGGTLAGNGFIIGDVYVDDAVVPIVR